MMSIPRKLMRNHETVGPLCGNGQLWRWQGDVFPLAKRLPTNKNCSRLVFFGCKSVFF